MERLNPGRLPRLFWVLPEPLALTFSRAQVLMWCSNQSLYHTESSLMLSPGNDPCLYFLGKAQPRGEQ